MTMEILGKEVKNSGSRYLLGPCMNGRHEECHISKTRLNFNTGKPERLFCECPCHVKQAEGKWRSG
jgi:hypothetical protein